MSKSQILGERVRILTDQLLAIPTTMYQQRSLQAALHLFLDPATKTALHRAVTVSKSALSRFLNEYDWDTTACWRLLNRAQWDALLLAARHQRRARLRLSLDLTSLEKTGKQLPFVRVYNEVHGIHLVVLFAEYRAFKFPIAYRVYRGKGTATPVSLALELLEGVPDDIRRRFQVCVLADSGFEAAVFLDRVRALGFEFVVGVRATRRTLHPGSVTVADCEHGAWLELHNWPHDTLTLARIERGDRTFFSVASELWTGDEVAAEGGKRWNIESFFKEGKHQFGLAQFALRTARGLDRWVLLVFLAFTLTMLHRTADLTLEQSAFLALTVALPGLRLNAIFARLAQDQEFLRQHGYSITYARCNS